VAGHSGHSAPNEKSKENDMTCLRFLKRGLFAIMMLPVLMARADSTVVFNEIMYHPATNETALEWVELHSQMAVDMDISNWRIEGGIDFVFPEGTVVPGGGYLVIALSPTALTSMGVTNVLGPFTGRLSNGGETLELRNNNNRLMDSVSYGVEDNWPVGADGAGPSLSKIDEDSISDKAGNWGVSEWNGGTPGARNFPSRAIIVARTNAVLLESQWRYYTNGTPPDAAWRDVSFNDAAWNSGAGLFFAGAAPPAQLQSIPTLFSSGIDANGFALAPGFADPHYVLTASAFSTPPPPAIPATVTANHPNWLGNDANSTWIGPISSGATSIPPGNYNYRTTFDLTGFDRSAAQITLQAAVDNELNNVLLNGVSIGLRYTNFASLSTPFVVTNGFVAGTNTLDFQTVNITAAASPGGFRVKASGVAPKFVATNTPVALGSTTFYFRKAFVFDGDPAVTAFELRSVADDGAVFYLNGVELFRQNMPDGAVNHSTFAVTNVGTAQVAGPFRIPAGALIPGTNVLAVELHQAAAGGNDALFGAELALLATNVPPALPPTLAFNEVSSVTNGQFWVEIHNYGRESVTLDGNVLSRFGNPSNASFVIPTQTLPPGGFLVLDKATVGFGADPGDQIILYAGGRTGVLDGVIAKSFPRARSPDGTGEWLYPTALTPGASNQFVFRDEIVINEIMYSHRELPHIPEVRFTNMLLTMTNAWRYDQSGQELGSAWRALAYDDSLWSTGRALLWTGLTGTNLLALRGTTLNLSNGPQPIITYYFRAAFVFTNNPTNALLTLNHYVDDGAVFYLNGAEIYRYGINANPAYATNLANFNIGVPTNAGPIVLVATNLVVGTNILAVEVHQVFPPPASRDLVFGMELVASGIVSPAVPARESPESWVELYNRSLDPVDLTGWRLDNAVSFHFPTGTVLPADGYLIVAKDAAYLSALYPGISVLGNFEGNLSKAGEAVVLKDPNDNPADKVRYYDDRPWPPFADGRGSSIELRDPFADNSLPEAWADSDEGRNSEWQTYTYRRVATAEPAASPTTWREFVFGLLGEGEVWLDDFSVIENPNTVRKQLLQNGTFENGLSAWRFLGNHRRAEVIVDPSNGANHILRLVTDGDTEHMHNHAETTLTNNLSITNGVEYEISFRAKWIAGCNKLNTRLYFNRVARTTDLLIPELNGTPGARNSRYATNIGPTFAGLQHQPVVPLAVDTVTISVTASDPDNVASATLFYSVNGGTWQSVSMPVTPAASVKLEASVPPQLPLSVIQFYVEATDALGHKATYPASGAASRALYAVGGQSLMPRLRSLRLLMPPADVAFMHQSTNVMSNERYGCTVITDESGVFYNASLHLQASERGRDVSSRVGFRVRLPADQLYRGVHESFTVDRSGGYSGLGGKHDEILLKHAVNKAGGLPGMYDDLVQVFAPRSSEDGTGLLIMAKYDSVFLDSQFNDGSDGETYKLELIYSPTTTVSGDPQAPKLPQPDGVLGTDIRNLGDDSEAYRWTFLKENHITRDNYAPMIALAKAFDLTGAALDAETRRLMDVDEWLRAVAFINLLGGSDIYSMGNSHNLQIYFRPGDNRGMALLWDMDFSFVNPTNQAFPGSGSPNTSKLVTTIPDNYRRFYGHLLELTAVTGDTAYMNKWASHYAGLLGQNWNGAVNFLLQRAAYVRSQLPLNTAFAIGNNGGNDFTTTNSQVILNGTAPLTVKEILVNGVSYPITWTGLTTWSILVPLTGPTNVLSLQTLDGAGQSLTNSDSITIVNNGLAAPMPVIINEWVAANSGPGGFPDPVDGLFQDWFELYNPNDVPVNLSGFYLTDTLAQPGKWQIPPNTVIGPRGFLLVWADNQTNQNGLGTNGDLHASFQLNNGGEELALYSTNFTPQHAVVFGAQIQNVSQGLFSDGATNAIYSMTNWTPRRPNQLGAPASPDITNLVFSTSGTLSFEVRTVANRLYRIEVKENLAAPFWTPLATNRATSASILVSDTWTNRVQRFYRAALVP
jgi:hypothetical protein